MVSLTSDGWYLRFDEIQLFIFWQHSKYVEALYFQKLHRPYLNCQIICVVFF